MYTSPTVSHVRWGVSYFLEGAFTDTGTCTQLYQQQSPEVENSGTSFPSSLAAYVTTGPVESSFEIHLLGAWNKDVIIRLWDGGTFCQYPYSTYIFPLVSLVHSCVHVCVCLKCLKFASFSMSHCLNSLCSDCWPVWSILGINPADWYATVYIPSSSDISSLPHILASFSPPRGRKPPCVSTLMKSSFLQAELSCSASLFIHGCFIVHIDSTALFN